MNYVRDDLYIPHGFQHIDVFLNEYYTIPLRYQFIRYLGRGTQGFAIRAHDTVTRTDVVIKKIDLPEDTADRAPFKKANRELKCMMHISHPNIVGFRSVFTPYQTAESMRHFYIVREFVDGTMRQLIPHELNHDVVKRILHGLCRGVQVLHRLQIAHRDLKPTNILVSEDVDVKLCDFGQSNTADPFMATPYVVMRYYRAPEIVCHVGMDRTLLNVDVWSIGCILSELFTEVVTFPGADHIDQYLQIIQCLGTPPARFYERMPEQVRNYVAALPYFPQRRFDDIFPSSTFLPGFQTDPEMCGVAKDLLSRMLVVDPEDRITLEQVFLHPYLREEVEAYVVEDVRPDERLFENFRWQNYIDGNAHRQEIFATIQSYCREHDIFNDVELPADFNL